jgi:dTDP-4-dehydrorhamnose reductase
MKILIVGHNGMLGTDMFSAAIKAGHEVSGVDFPDIDITRLESVRACLRKDQPDTVINCAAFTAVDACETEVQKAFAVNAEGAGNLAVAAKEVRSIFVHYSTDYVFDGAARVPYIETDPTGPASVYGRSKLEGERLVAANNARSFIIRIAWLYGTAGNHFVKTIRNLAQKNAVTGGRLRVVNDQIGSPTCTLDICNQTLCLLETGYFGLYHATSEGQCSWYDFAQEIRRAAGISVRIDPCTTAEFPRPAPRPSWSVLENAALKKLGLNRMPHWKDAFSTFTKVEAHYPR